MYLEDEAPKVHMRIKIAWNALVGWTITVTVPVRVIDIFRNCHASTKIQVEHGKPLVGEKLIHPTPECFGHCGVIDKKAPKQTFYIVPETILSRELSPNHSGLGIVYAKICPDLWYI